MKKTPDPISRSIFLQNCKNEKIDLFSIQNNSGMLVQLTNFGGRVVSLWAVDNNGDFDNIVFGFDQIEQYFVDEQYFGSIIGRFANRICNGQFDLNNKKFKLQRNLGEHHLHGGDIGFHNAVWNVIEHKRNSLELEYFSEAMESGYPGNLSVRGVFSLTEENEFIIEYWGKTDTPTPVNLSHHCYFNLNGFENGDICNHQLQLISDYYLPTNAASIPTGEIAKVDGTPMDFREHHQIGDRIENNFDQLIFGKGYDHCWVINGSKNDKEIAAEILSPKTNRLMQVHTNQPGIQFYSGNHLPEIAQGRNIKAISARHAFCLETQHFPDSPNHAHFPSTILKENEIYYSVCGYTFSVK